MRRTILFILLVSVGVALAADIEVLELDEIPEAVKMQMIKLVNAAKSTYLELSL